MARGPGQGPEGSCTSSQSGQDGHGFRKVLWGGRVVSRPAALQGSQQTVAGRRAQGAGAGGRRVGPDPTQEGGGPAERALSAGAGDQPPTFPGHQPRPVSAQSPRGLPRSRPRRPPGPCHPAASPQAPGQSEAGPPHCGRWDPPPAEPPSGLPAVLTPVTPAGRGDAARGPAQAPGPETRSVPRGGVGCGRGWVRVRNECPSF